MKNSSALNHESSVKDDHNVLESEEIVVLHKSSGKKSSCKHSSGRSSGKNSSGKKSSCKHSSGKSSSGKHSSGKKSSGKKSSGKHSSGKSSGKRSVNHALKKAKKHGNDKYMWNDPYGSSGRSSSCRSKKSRDHKRKCHSKYRLPTKRIKRAPKALA
ncbi:hypothetical protein ACJROX_09260 [Pseudalkalibacillus sp. A8]|uniref:hypothetical protein n=1 Tax=Pseudalkalibacillus sp. A8 TaxID=3382641 RepID=UPI0038B610A1